MSSSTYNYAIIGAGAAGLHLALAIAEDPWFQDKSILILDKDAKTENDKTWCFWEKGPGKWDDLTHHQWEKGHFYNLKRHVPLEMRGYRYKMLRSLDFYDHGKEVLRRSDHITRIQDEVREITEGSPVIISGTEHTYSAEYVFDSRIPVDFFRGEDNYLRLLQHFKGWVIETEKPSFNPGEFTMMDFRLRWEESTSFTYVLPISEHRALVEFTLFTPDLIPDDGYDRMLRHYVREILNIERYSVLEVEKGIIPMSDFPFENYHTEHIVKIGTAGGWVKPSSGYSFKFAEKYADRLASEIKQGGDLLAIPDRGRFRFYDSLFLDVLVNKNHLGSDLFGAMYRNNRADKIFRFLDEETSLPEELYMLNTFPWKPFISALWKRTISG